MSEGHSGGYLGLQVWGVPGFNRRPEASVAVEDYRPRPRLTWGRSAVAGGWQLCFGTVSVATAAPAYTIDWTRSNDGANQQDVDSLRTACIHLRLVFIGRGFDVEDVPAEVLNG